MLEDHSGLVKASDLERLGILPRGTSYRMAKAGLIPSYQCGVTGRGVRFSIPEVLEALRRPVKSEEGEQ